MCELYVNRTLNRIQTKILTLEAAMLICFSKIGFQQKSLDRESLNRGDQVALHVNAVFLFDKLTSGFCLIQTCAKFTSRKSSE